MTDRDRETARRLFPCVCDLPDPCPCMEAREKIAAALRAARQEEREACARVADEMEDLPEPTEEQRRDIESDPVGTVVAAIRVTKVLIAARIRVRGGGA